MGQRTPWGLTPAFRAPSCLPGFHTQPPCSPACSLSSSLLPSAQLPAHRHFGDSGSRDRQRGWHGRNFGCTCLSPLPQALLSSSSQYGENRSPAVPGTLGFPPRRGRRKKPRPLAPDPLENYASSHSKAHQDGDEGAGREKQCQGGAS